MHTNLRKLILSSLFTALTFIGVIIKIPTPLAPFTLQLVFTLMAGFILGPKYGAISQIIYIILGLIGIPIFAYGGGLGYIVHPTFGFLLGFIATAFVAGYIFDKKVFKNIYINSSFAGLMGLISCYIIGLPYLYLIFNLYMGVEKTIFETIKGGMLIFLPGDIVKISIAVLLSIPISKRLSLK